MERWRRASRCIQLRTTGARSEEHTSELQSQSNLVCRLLLEKKKKGEFHGSAATARAICAKEDRLPQLAGCHELTEPLPRLVGVARSRSDSDYVRSTACGAQL